VIWEEITVPAVGSGGERLTALVRFTTDGVCVVEITVDDVDSRGDGPDLFEALAQGLSRSFRYRGFRYPAWCVGPKRAGWPAVASRF